MRDISSSAAPVPWLSNKPVSRLKDDEALALIDARCRVTNASQASYFRLQRLWFECCAQFAGIQSRRDLNLLLRDVDRAHPMGDLDDIVVFNHLFHHVSYIASRLAQQRGSFDVVPPTSDYRDVQAAKVGKQLLDHFHHDLGLDEVRRELGTWLACTGNGFLGTTWDAKAGRELTIHKDPVTGRRIAPQDEEEAKWYEEMGATTIVPEGNLAVEALSGFNIRAPRNCKRIRDAGWVIIERIKPIEWVWENYPKEARELQPSSLMSGMRFEDGSFFLVALESVVSQSHNPFGGSISAGMERDEQVVIRELWIPPNGLLKKGAYIVAAPGILLENSIHPSVEAKTEAEKQVRHPLAHARYMLQPGRLWGTGPVEHALGPQAETNEAYNWQRDYRDTMRPVLPVPKGHSITSINTDFGQALEHDMPSMPAYLEPPSPNQAVFTTGAQAMDAMNRVFARNDVTQGQTPPNVRTGVAIRALQEQDLATSGISVQELEDAWARSSTTQLILARRYMTEERAIQVYSDSFMVDVRAFKGSDLRDSLRVIPKRGSMVPKSRTETAAMIQDSMALGGLDPADPRDKRVIIEGLDLGVNRISFRIEDLQRRNARLENDTFSRFQINPKSGIVMIYDELSGRVIPAMGSTGDIIPFPDVDDDDIDPLHLEEHMEFKQTDQYKSLHPIVQLAFDAHSMKHKRKLAQLQAAMAMSQQQPTAAGAAGPGQPSPPREAGQPSKPKLERSETK